MPYALFVLSWALLTAGTPPAVEVEAKCCFTNSAYTGTCQVTPQADETCKSILDYLNTPNSVGKSYCGETNIRGGWQQTSCGSGAQVQDRQVEAAAGEHRTRGTAVRQ